MNFFSDKKKIVQTLFAAAVFILIANIVVDKIIGKTDAKVVSEISGIEVNEKFLVALKNFGIDSSWIKIKKRSPKDHDSLYVSYNIDVPKDLPITLLLKEITNSYDTSTVRLNAVEKKIGGRTFLEIISGSESKLLSEFNYKEGIKRKAGTIAFLIENLDDLEEQQLLSLLNSSEAFAAVIIPSKVNTEFVKTLIANRKEFVVILNDDISDLEYKLSSNYSEPRLKSSLRSIIGAYGKAIFVMIDDNSSLHSSSVYPLLKSELGKRKIKLLNKSSFKIPVHENSEVNIRSYFSSLNDNESKAVILTAEEYSNIHSMVIDFRKVGYKFVSPSMIIL